MSIRGGSVPTLALALACAGPAGTSGQDEAAVHSAVAQIFEGMRTSDAELVRTVFAPDARFALVDADGTGIVVQPVTGWLNAIAASQGRWNERLYDVEVRVDGAMASVWAPYTFYLDGVVRHCGINSIELLHDGGGWKVTQISDTRLTDVCPDPLGSG